MHDTHEVTGSTPVSPTTLEFSSNLCSNQKRIPNPIKEVESEIHHTSQPRITCRTEEHSQYDKFS